MDLIKIWQIKCNDNIVDFLSDICSLHEEHMTYLLNSNGESNIIEKIIYDIAKFHFNNLNMDIKNKYIEFWFKKYDNNINTICHTDCDEYDKIINKSKKNKPLLSCVTYLNDNEQNPTLIMEVDDDDYKYKTFKKKKIALSLPKKLKQITFDGGKYYHGNIHLKSDEKNLKRDIIIINLWDKKPLNVPYFNYDAYFFKYTMKLKFVNDLFYYCIDDEIIEINENNDNIINIQIDNPTFLNNEFFENILYEDTKDKYLFEEFKILLNEYKNNDTFIFENIEKENIEKENIEKENIEKENTNIIDINNNSKFLQRFVHKKHFTKDICKWIINECEEYASKNNGWMTNRHKIYSTTDIPVENIQTIFKFILTSFSETIIKKIKNNYDLDDNTIISINDLFVVKYEYDKQNYLELHTDISSISVNILLSDTSDFEGGGTFFEDGLTISLKQGDMLFHSSKVKHSGKKILYGKRYVLVFFIDLLSKL